MMWIKYRMFFKYKRSNGVTECQASLKFFIEFLLKLIYARLTKRKFIFQRYKIEPHFKGWPKEYIGRRLNVLITGISLRGNKKL